MKDNDRRNVRLHIGNLAAVISVLVTILTGIIVAYLKFK